MIITTIVIAFAVSAPFIGVPAYDIAFDRISKKIEEKKEKDKHELGRDES